MKRFPAHTKLLPTTSLAGNVRIALTGTPGTGKSTLARGVADLIQVHELGEVARQVGAVVGRDQQRQTDEVDLDVLAAATTDLVGLLVGHYAHDLPVDFVVVLRTPPGELATRLRARGYPEAKVRENAEVEALDLILSEAVATGAPVAEHLTTGVTTSGSIAWLRTYIGAPFGDEVHGRFDFSAEVDAWS